MILWILLCSILCLLSTESEDINKDEHSSTLELDSFDFFLTNSEISTKIPELLMLN
jgi:hypothetical protein